jgi:hypothetical protein
MYFFDNLAVNIELKRLGFPTEFLGMQIQHFPAYNAIIYSRDDASGLGTESRMDSTRSPTTPLSVQM